MSISVVCPGCSAKLNAPDGAAGKKLKCPKCQGAITVPAPEAQFEVVEDEPAPPAKKPAPAPAPAAKPRVKADVEVDDDEDEPKPRKKPVKAEVEEDDEDEKPKKKRAKAVAEVDEDEEDAKPRKKAKAVAEVDDADEKPRKKKRRDEDEDEEDEDDRPRKKKKKKGAAGVSMTRNIVGGVLLLVLLGVAAFVFYDKFKDREEAGGTASNNSDTGGDTIPPPPGGIPPPPGRPKLPGPAPKPPPADAPNFFKTKITETPVLSPDGTLALAGEWADQGFVVGVWNLQTGARYATVGDGVRNISSYGISPDKTQAATVSVKDRTMSLWVVPSGRLVKTVPLPTDSKSEDYPPFVAYTPDGKAVVTTLGNKLFRVDTAAGQAQVLKAEFATFGAAYCPIHNIAVEHALNKSTNDFEVRVYDLTAGGAPKVIPGGADENLYAYVDISADGKTVSVGVSFPAEKKLSDAIYLYEVATGRLKGKVPVAEPGTKSELDGARISPDGGRVIVWGRTGEGPTRKYHRILATGTGEVLKTTPEPGLLYVSRFATGAPVAVVATTNGPRVYDAKTDTERDR